MDGKCESDPFVCQEKTYAYTGVTSINQINQSIHPSISISNPKSGLGLAWLGYLPTLHLVSIMNKKRKKTCPKKCTGGYIYGSVASKATGRLATQKKKRFSSIIPSPTSPPHPPTNHTHSPSSTSLGKTAVPPTSGDHTHVHQHPFKSNHHNHILPHDCSAQTKTPLPSSYSSRQLSQLA